MKVGVVVFPGSNCEQDIRHVYQNLLSIETKYIWHRDRVEDDFDLIVVPGGFSYGDYLRCGAMAKLSPAMQDINKASKSGVPVLGVCNGFQILCEAELLPGVLVRNIERKFISTEVNLKTAKPFGSLEAGEVVSWPMAHGEGNYFCDGDTLKELEDNNQIAFLYSSESGEVNESSRESNPNGSLRSIAGVTNKEGNVSGLMPHPERAADPIIGAEHSEKALNFFRSFLK